MELDENIIEYIEKKLHEKNLNIQTQDYIIKYIYINQKLFGNFLDIYKMIDRITNNLDHNIAIFNDNNPITQLATTSLARGSYNPSDKKIGINPIIKLRSFLFTNEQQRQESTILHEIDHCATTTYFDISENEKDKYIESYIKIKQIKNPKILDFFRKNVNKKYQEFDGILPVSGILDYRYLATEGIDLRKLNEGITAYKQELYDKFLGNNPHTSYTAEKKIAHFIADIIGKENLISMHFNNDYASISSAFYEKTGKNLNELVKQLNKKSMLKTFMFGRLYTNTFYKKIEKVVNDIKPKRENTRNTDFIPKYNIDFEKNKKFVEPEKHIEQRTEKEI